MASAIDEDTMRTVQSGRETAGTLLRGAQKHLQKVFIVWVAVMLATIIVLQNFLWDTLRRDLLYSQMDLTTAQASQIIAVTPFDVILLQFKIGAVLGILVAFPLLVYFSRDALRERGYWPSQKVPTWKLATLGTVATALFVGGVLYAYFLFFPLMFGFLAESALSADFQPNYSIVMWVQFVVLLGMSFGLAAQMPLMMSALSYTEIVPYETFRDRWKYAVVGIFAFGALFSPPDPFTQIMWAAPLVGLYVVSLGLSKMVVLAKRAGEEVNASEVALARWNKLAAGAVVTGGLVYYVISSPLFEYVQAFAAWFPSNRLTGDLTRPAWFGLSPEATAVLIGVLVGLVAAVLVLYYYMIQELDVAAAEAGHFGDPTEIDVGSLTAPAVQAAPREAFEEMPESEALQLADRAMSDDDTEKARAILDRWDSVHGTGDGGDGAAGDGAAGDAEAADEEDAGVFTQTTAGMFNAFTEEETTEDDIGGYYHDLAFIFSSLTSKAIWFVGTFMLVAAVVFIFLYSGIPGAADAAIADGGTVVADNGTVVADNLTVAAEHVTVLEENESASNRGSVVANDAVLTTRNGTSTTRASTAVLQNDSVLLHNATVIATNASAGSAPGSYQANNATVLIQNETVVDTTSGIGMIKNAFVSHLPPEMRGDVQFITLHPVEHLVFIVKFAGIMGGVAVLPLLLYFAWPAMRERNFVGGDRNTLAVWGGTIALTLVGGSLVGFLYVAPTVISWLAYDVLQASMIISYRVAKFGWLVLMFTVGIGLLIEIPVTMLLFHRGGILPYQALQDRWRPITLGVFAAGALFSPKGIWTMFLVAIPITVAFMVGLALLWIYTLGGRRTPKARGKAAD